METLSEKGQCPVTGKGQCPVHGKQSAAASVNFFDPAYASNPHAVLSMLREEGPVHRITVENDYPLWLITRYEDAIALLKDPRITKMKSKVQAPDQEPALLIDKIAALNTIGEHMLTTDPPIHTRLRSLVSKAFTPRLIEQLRPRVEEVTNELLDKVQHAGKMEFVNDFAYPLPLTIIGEVLGVNVEDREQLRIWSNLLFEGYTTEENFHEVSAAADGFIEYLRRTFEERRATPGDDLISKLLEVEEAGDKLSEKELYSMVFLLLVAGHETTVNLIGNGLLMLIQHPEQMARLKREPELIHSAIEEMLRYDGPTATSTIRFALEDIEIGGVTIPRGEEVLIITSSANRDERKFEDADKFDITRKDNRHLGFGHGIHFCIGAPLARLECEVALTTILRRLPNIRLDIPENELPWRLSILTRGLMSMPVAF